MKYFALLLLVVVLAANAAQTLTNVNLGTVPNDRTGDSLRSAGSKINTNFVFLQAQITALQASVSSGVTTNVNVIIAGGATNQLQFTSGILTAVVPQ